MGCGASAMESATSAPTCGQQPQCPDGAGPSLVDEAAATPSQAAATIPPLPANTRRSSTGHRGSIGASTGKCGSIGGFAGKRGSVIGRFASRSGSVVSTAAFSVAGELPMLLPKVIPKVLPPKTNARAKPDASPILKDLSALSASKIDGIQRTLAAPARRGSLSIPENLHAERMKMASSSSGPSPSASFTGDVDILACYTQAPRSPPIGHVRRPSMRSPRTRTTSSLQSLSEEGDDSELVARASEEEPRSPRASVVIKLVEDSDCGWTLVAFYRPR